MRSSPARPFGDPRDRATDGREREHPRYSVVIPVFNEQENLPLLGERLREVFERLDGTAEVILVNDGSRDSSYSLMLELSARDPRFKLVNLSRNFGHQIALTAGLDFSTGDAVIAMDADLQDPPEVVPELIERWKDGYDVVYAVRKRREGETLFKRFSAAVFYRLLRKLTDVDIPADVGDFRLVDRRVLNALGALRENSRFLRGMFSWLGFKQAAVYYHREERFAGQTKYPLRRMVKLAVDAILGFSNVPLRAALGLGVFVSVLAFATGAAAIIAKLGGADFVPGWASTVVAVAFLGGIQLAVLGVIGEYLGRIYEEVRRRPLYVVSEHFGFHHVLPATDRAVIPDRPQPEFVTTTTPRQPARAEYTTFETIRRRAS